MKRVGLYVSFFTVLMFSLAFVSATNHGGPISQIVTSMGDGFNALFGNLNGFFKVIFGAELGTGSSTVTAELVTNIMIFTLLFAIIFAVVERIHFLSDNDAIKWIVTIAVSILATRWLVQPGARGLIEAVLLPYSVLGVSIAAFLPLVIYFVLLEFVFQGRRNRVIRKAGWIFFGVVFIFLWIGRYASLESINRGALWIYPISAALCFLLFWKDGTIQVWLSKMRIMSTVKNHQDRVRLGHLYHQLEDLRVAANNGAENFGGHPIHEQERNILNKISEIESGESKH